MPPGMEPPRDEPPSILQHGRAFSSDEDGDGPGLTVDAFFKAWAAYSLRAGNLRVADAMCRSQYMYFLLAAWMRWRLHRLVNFPEDPDSPYREWDCYAEAI